MANVIITTKETEKCFEFDFGDYASEACTPKKLYLLPSEIVNPLTIININGDEIVRLFIANVFGFCDFTPEGDPKDGTYIVDEIDGNPVADNDELLNAFLTMRITTL